MSIDFGWKDRVLGVWFAGKESGDLLGCAWIPEGKDEIKLVWRFRESHSSDPWDEKDTKRWYGGVRPGASTEDQQSAIDVCDHLFGELATQLGYTVDKIGPGSGQDVLNVMESGVKAWCHVRKVPAALVDEVNKAYEAGESVMDVMRKGRN